MGGDRGGRLVGRLQRGRLKREVSDVWPEDFHSSLRSHHPLILLFPPFLPLGLALEDVLEGGVDCVLGLSTQLKKNQLISGFFVSS
jgi:hypothetical protein